MIKKVLLINSDLAKNRGDRAIAEGNIQLIKRRFPKAVITGISEQPDRDERWFGISFLNMNFQSLSPLALLRLCMVARQNDIILWGGGEILKDYTNKAALWYWVIKMTIISLFNGKLYGAYQGIGPTKSDFSKKLIVFAVKRCKVFIVRDEESYQKLLTWGTPKEILRYASDPAVLPKPKKLSKELAVRLEKRYNIDQAFLDNFICIGPRDWFHYKPGGVIPFKYKQQFYKLFGKKINTTSKKHTLYLDQLSKMISELTKKHNTHVLLVPMHMGESDSSLCHFLREHSANPSVVRVLDDDNLSPSELRTVISNAKAMVGFRLHSNIIGISAGVPSVNIYYVDKGRVFFDQIKQSTFAQPIESVLKDDFVPKFIRLFDTVFSRRTQIREDIEQATQTLRKSVSDTFEEVFDAKNR